MASTASIASASRSEQPSNGSTSQPQAGPLPRKRGELGFQEDLNAQEPISSASGAPSTPLPAHHPEERGGVLDHALVDSPAPHSSPNDPGARPPVDTASVHTAGKRSIISRLKPKHILGLCLTAILRAVVQFIALGGTIVGWALLISMLARKAAERRAETGASGPSFDTTIFVHVAFAIATLGQLVFLERVIFLLRAQRYSYLHPGSELPTSRRRLGGGPEVASPINTALAFAPWNRPPLPTYAAALVESGHGTGDVEDSVIAVPPPPAYGQTRGSTMLLSGFMSETLRAQASAARDSVGSQLTVARDRPMSYMSRDSAWEERVNADRAVQLEETLARLEDPEGRPSITHPT